MDIKVSQLTQVSQVQQVPKEVPADGSFKFTLAIRVEDVKDMKRYRGLIKDFLNEVVARSHNFSRENFLDRKGRHRVYGIIRLIDQNLDDLAQELMKDEKDNLMILSKIGEIEGLLLDIFT